MTLEHIVPRWAYEVVDSDPRESVDPGRHKLFTKHLGEERAVEWTNHRSIEFKAKCVCASCNGGWMSAIESQTKPILEQMIRGNETELDHKAQAAIARWLGLKAIIERYAQSPITPVGKDVLRYFYEHRMPPKNWFILITGYIGTYPVWITTDTYQVTKSYRSAIPFAVKNYRMLVTLAIGYFAGQVYAPEEQMSLKVRSDAGVIRIWPPQSSIAARPARWPPNGVLTDETLKRVSEMVDGMPRR